MSLTLKANYVMHITEIYGVLFIVSTLCVQTPIFIGGSSYLAQKSSIQTIKSRISEKATLLFTLNLQKEKRRIKVG